MNGHDGVSRDQHEISPAGAPAPRKTRTAAFARLKKRSEFLATAKGVRQHEAAFTLQAIAREASGDSDADARRFGLTITKKTGNSVVRNRIRRRLREALRLSGAAGRDVAEGRTGDYVIVARREALSRDFTALASDIAGAVTRADRRLAKPKTKPAAP